MSLKRNTPLKRGSNTLKRSRLKPVSAKRAKENREYSERRKVFLNKHPLCQLTIQESNIDERVAVCLWKHIGSPEPGLTFYNIVSASEVFIPVSIQVHHKNKRHGARLNDESEWMAVSAEGHEKIESNKKWARANGFLNDI